MCSLAWRASDLINWKLPNLFQISLSDYIKQIGFKWHTWENVAHIVGLTDSHQESSIFVLICQEVAETLDPVHLAKEPPDEDKSHNKSVRSVLVN